VKIVRILCDICEDEEVDPDNPGHIHIEGHSDLMDPEKVGTFDSDEVGPNCMRLIFECIERRRPAVKPGNGQLLKRLRP